MSHLGIIRHRVHNIANTLQPFFGAMGCTVAIVFTCLGASYGTAKSGVGISAMGVLRPDLIVKSTNQHPQSMTMHSWYSCIDIC